ncbi:WD40 repeat domain-containing protein [Chitinophaga silvatica]|uniref:WD40 repeat domain-containing protein n=2 Tax=Chitinophaga silvatica TaxID=2282649 RepID=A0A3E1YG64_9BACT|nr:WD40 repeat domain-containing protein [Chitinophaga silvatica]
MVIAEQSQNRIIIIDAANSEIVWEWKAANSNVKPKDVKWFNTPSDAKVVYNSQYVLMNASGGGVALIRIADKKTVFYAYAGGNTHSAELLPDGNIVTASSTDNYLMLFKTDTVNYPEVYKKKIYITFGHNVVWDKQRNRLWSAGLDTLIAFKYNYDCEHPDLIEDAVYPIPGKDSHDLFPVYGSGTQLWFTNENNVYQFDVITKKFVQAEVIQQDIKSISNGPKGYPTIIVKPKEQWWTDEVLDAAGKRVAGQAGWKIYKARWVLPNDFGYPKNQQLKLCK